MIEFKGLREALTLKTVRDELIHVLKIASVFSSRRGEVIRITSMNDHVHGPNSLHKNDLAVDMQILSKSGPNKRAMNALAKHLKARLPYGYDVIWNSPGHRTHIHVEWDDGVTKREAT